MVFILENAIFVLSRVGHLHSIFKPDVGHLQLFQNKMTNARQMPEGGCARLELTEPYFCALLLCRRRESNKFADQIRIELQELRKHA